MSDTKKYKALGPIWHDGQVYSAGAFIPMTDECAARLLGLKGVPRIEVIAEEAPVDPPAGNPPEDVNPLEAPPKAPEPEDVPVKVPAPPIKGKGKK